MSSRRWPAFALLGLTFVIWSNSFIAARLLVGETAPESMRVGPLDFVVVRFVPVALFCVVWFGVSRRARGLARTVLARRWALVLLLGLLNVWGYNLAFAAGQHLVPPGTASLVITLNPVLTFVIAVAIRQERFSFLRAIGLVVAFAGVYLVVTRGAGRAVTGAYLHDALLLACAPVTWALYTVLAKPVLADTDGGSRAALDLTYVVIGLGSLPALGFAVARGGLHRTVAAWDPARWCAALFLALGCSVVAYGLWFVALARVPASTAAAFVFLNPPLTLGFEWVWFGSTPAAGLLVGGVLVLLGVGLVIHPSLLGSRRRRVVEPV